MYCFGDFEFTCSPKSNAIGREILSIGLVICDDSFNMIDKYYSLAKPVLVPKLGKFCTELTHLQQEDIDEARDSDVVCKEALEFLNKYNINKIYSYGNFDEIAIKQDYKIHQRKELNFEEIKMLQKKVKDVNPYFVKKIGTRDSISIAKYLEIFEITIEGELHNALTDAIALMKIYEQIEKNDDFTKYPFIAEKIEIAEKNRILSEFSPKMRRKIRQMGEPNIKFIEDFYVLLTTRKNNSNFVVYLNFSEPTFKVFVKKYLGEKLGKKTHATYIIRHCRKKQNIQNLCYDTMLFLSERHLLDKYNGLTIVNNKKDILV